MIYILKKNKSIYITEKQSEVEQENNTPIFTFSWDLSVLIKYIREWKILSIPGNWYYPDVLGYFEDNKNNQTPEPIENQVAYETWKNNMLDLINETLDKLCTNYKLHELKLLVDYKTKKHIEDNISYTCDIPNYLQELYGNKLAKLVLDFIELEQNEKNYIDEFYKQRTKESQKNLIDKINNLHNIIEFLPSWCRLQIKVYSDGKISKQNSIPQFKNNTKLDDPELEQQNIQETLKQDIYSEFNIGEIIRGSEIRTRLKEVYEKNGITKTAKLVDLLEYFTITKARSEYEWFYRIVNRKLI